MNVLDKQGVQENEFLRKKTMRVHVSCSIAIIINLPLNDELPRLEDGWMRSPCLQELTD